MADKGIAQREPFLIEAARQLARLIAYKDEYEVARLYIAPEFRAALGDRFGGAPKLQVWLAPPLLPLGKDARTGRPRKIAFGGWIFPVFRVLAGMKSLRGRWCDPFGHTAERRMERALAGEYLAMLHAAIAGMTPDKLARAVELAAAPREVAGFGAVKEAGVSRWREQAATLMERLAD